jgi:hypothetical protein
MPCVDSYRVIILEYFREEGDSVRQHHQVRVTPTIQNMFKTVLQIRDVNPGSEFSPSRIRIFPSRIPDPYQRVLVF